MSEVAIKPKSLVSWTFSLHNFSPAARSPQEHRELRSGPELYATDFPGESALETDPENDPAMESQPQGNVFER